MENQQKRITRVAVIGAGAAGLTAALTLQDAGHEVTVFETSGRAGGKCFSVAVDGKMYELGAGILAANNRVALHLAKRFGVKKERVTFGKSRVVDGSGHDVPPRSLRRLLRLGYEAMVKYPWLVVRFGGYRLGHARSNVVLAMPFSAFADRYHLHELEQEFALFFTGFGYDYCSRVSTKYVMAYMSLGALWSFVTRQIYWFPDGIQSIWTAVARSLSVRLHTNITQVIRGDHVVLTTQKGEEVFDHLVIACPLSSMEDVLDVRDDERVRWSAIRYVDYRTVTVRVKGLPEQSGYVPENFSPDHTGDVVYWHWRYPTRDVVMAYALCNEEMTDDDVADRVRAFFTACGGEVTKVVRVDRFTYFPHVTPEDFQNGWYDDMENAQGNNHTTIIGEIMNFSTVGCTTAYAKRAMERLIHH